MNVKLVVGIVLFVIGLATAVMGITRVGQNEVDAAAVAVAETGEARHPGGAVGQMTLPLIAGFSLAVGGLLIGLSVGNWRNPRTHLKPGDEVVNPEGYHKMKHV